jgi:hypothetical protein
VQLLLSSEVHLQQDTLEIIVEDYLVRIMLNAIFPRGIFRCRPRQILVIPNLSYQVALIPMAKPHGGTRSAMKYWHHSAWTGPQNVIAWSIFLPDDDGTLAADWKLSLLVDPPKETLDQLPPELCEEDGM